jgi:hypothetical protein
MTAVIEKDVDRSNIVQNALPEGRIRLAADVYLKKPMYILKTWSRQRTASGLRSIPMIRALGPKKLRNMNRDPTFKAALAVQIEFSVRQNNLDRARFLLTQYPAEGEHAPMHALLQQRVAFSEESFEASLVETALLVETDPKLIIARELFSQHFARFMQSGHANRYCDFVDALGLHFDLSRIVDRQAPDLCK